MCVCVLTQYVKKYSTNRLHFWWQDSLWRNAYKLRKIAQDKGGRWWSKIGPNDNIAEKTFRVAIIPKRWEKDIQLLLDTNRKSHMGSPNARLDVTLSDHERWTSRSLIFERFIACKGAYLGPMLLSSINRKPYMGSPMAPSHLTLSDLESHIQGHPDFAGLYLAKEPT